MTDKDIKKYLNIIQNNEDTAVWADLLLSSGSTAEEVIKKLYIVAVSGKIDPEHIQDVLVITTADKKKFWTGTRHGNFSDDPFAARTYETERGAKGIINGAKSAKKSYIDMKWTTEKAKKEYKKELKLLENAKIVKAWYVPSAAFLQKNEESS